MNRLNILHWSISAKLLFGFALLGGLLSLLFAVTALTGANRINEQNLQLYLNETTNRKRERMQFTFDSLLIELESSLSDASVTQRFFQAFVQRNPRIANYLRDVFLPTRADVLIGAWLLQKDDGHVLAQAVVEGKTLPFDNPDQSDSQAFATAQALRRSGATRGLSVITVVQPNGEIVPVLELVDLIFDANGNFLGYLVIAIDGEALINPLLLDTNDLGAYSYLISPDGSAYLAHPRTRAEHDIDLDAILAQLRRQPDDSTFTYTLGADNQRQTVLAYYDTLEFFGQSFTLVTELEQQRISTQVFEYGQEVFFPVTVGGILIIVLLTVLLNLLLTPPLQDITGAMRTMLRGGMDVPVRGKQRRDEIGKLVNAFIEMRDQVRLLLTTAEQRLKDRDRDLRVTQDISGAITHERNLQMLMDTVVNLIIKNFPSIYHAQIFLIDSEGFAVLRASTGTPGKALLASGHRLAVGSVSVIGQVVEQGQLIVARDAAFSDVHRRNEFLPDTRAELAIPLRAGEIVIGALDVQSKQRDSFSPDLVNVLQTLAGQVSIALENVRLYEESQRQLAAIDQQRRTAARHQWQTYLNTHRQSDLTVNAGNQTTYDFSELRQQAAATSKPAVGVVTPHRTIPFVVPVQLRGEVLGMVDFEIPERDFRYDRVLLAEELVNRLAIGLDNARLFEESQQSAERERVVNTISAKITQQTDIETILQTALREVGIALRTPQVSVRLHLPAFEQRPLTPPDTNGSDPSAEKDPLPETERVTE